MILLVITLLHLLQLTSHVIMIGVSDVEKHSHATIFLMQLFTIILIVIMTVIISVVQILLLVTMIRTQI